MNTQPKHDLETGDLRGSAEIVVTPNGIDVGDLPNTDPATGDMRGHASSSIADAETGNSRMFTGAAAVAALIGALGVASYATGMWNSPPHAFAPRMAAAVPVAVPAVEMQHPVAPTVPKLAVVPAPVPAAPPIKAVAKPAPVHIAKRPIAPATHARPALTPPETASPEPLTPAPLEPVQIAPTPVEPTPALPDQTVPPAQPPQVKPTEPPQ